jgi:hypothetical protein
MKSQSETMADYRKYKELKPEQKIQCLFSQEDLALIETGYARLIADS